MTQVTIIYDTKPAMSGAVTGFTMSSGPKKRAPLHKILNPKNLLVMSLLNKMKPLLLLAFPALLITGCAKDPEETTPEPASVASCEGCHTNYAHLQAVYSPDTAPPAGGCGGEAPHYEPYDRVFMGGEGYTDYKKSGHYAIGCVGCHKGTGNTADKQTAHSGDFISHPSLFADETCGKCHGAIVDNFKTSLHNGTGQKRKVTMRSGLSGPDDFDKLPAHQIEGYNKNCATCHASCGECHIVRPPIGGGGLANGHEFTKTPDMVSVCVTCHVSRGGHAYLGVASGTQPDVHLTKAGYKCIDCHNADELHGDGQKVDQRYAYSKLPQCVDCHTGLERKNNYHKWHYESFNCQVCHSQEYNNCGSCHIHGEGARIPSYMDFKIASNPIPALKPGFNFTLVRRTLAAPDNWEKYGIAQYINFEAFPTYNYTSPHNILRWTARTQVEEGQACSSNCHIRNEGGVMVNKDIYLFLDDVLSWEYGATYSITVDGKLPPAWFISN
jgi:thiosulfate/3-mercaptopyruvate sulfurtransferase